jgi:amino acid transporter
MVEEMYSPEIKVPQAMSLCIPVGDIIGLFFILSIYATLPALLDIITSPSGQAIPYIFHIVMGSRDAAVGLVSLIFVIDLFCSISITYATSRTTWALAYDNALPLLSLFAHVDARFQIPLWSMGVVTLVQILLGFINLGRNSAFVVLFSVGVITLAIMYSLPIGISLFYDRRAQVAKAAWNCGHVLGTAVN